MKTFKDLKRASRYRLRDISHLYPDYAMPIGANDTVAIIVYFRGNEVRYTDSLSPTFQLCSEETIIINKGLETECIYGK